MRTDDERRQHKYCQMCKQYALANNKDWNETTQWCHGVYSKEDYEEIADLSKVDLDEVYELYDSNYWMAKYLEFEPYWYQDIFLKCTSARRVLRFGRRTGKTQVVCAYIFEKCVKLEGLKVLVITPHKSQGKEIWDRLIEYMTAAGLQNEVRYKQTPYYELNFKNGSRIRAFVSGSTSGSSSAVQVRGQEADIIYMDEMDYIDEESFKAIMPILTDPRRHGEVELIVSSTPSGKEGSFFRMCYDSNYKELHIPSSWRPDWDAKMEKAAREFAKTENIYQQEFMAEFGIKSDGVFKRSDVINALKEYRYHLQNPKSPKEQDWAEMKPWNHWVYMMGVDWNGEGNGSRIVILGFDPMRYKFIIAYRERIQAVEMSLHFAVERIVELNRLWRPRKIYIDAGFGQMQDEYLRGIGRAAAIAKAKGEDYNDADIAFTNDLRTVGFGSYIEYKTKDPITKEEITRKIRMKNYLVENLQRVFELNDIYIPLTDIELKQEIMGYSVKGQDVHGFLTYEADKEVGDHDLDALMLAAFAFNQEFDPYFHRKNDNSIILTKRPGAEKFEKPLEQEVVPDKFDNPINHEIYLENNKKVSSVPNRGIIGVKGNTPQARPAPNRGARNAWRKKAINRGPRTYGL